MLFDSGDGALSEHWSHGLQMVEGTTLHVDIH